MKKVRAVKQRQLPKFAVKERIMSLEIRLTKLERFSGSLEDGMKGLAREIAMLRREIGKSFGRQRQLRQGQQVICDNAEVLNNRIGELLYKIELGKEFGKASAAVMQRQLPELDEPSEFRK